MSSCLLLALAVYGLGMWAGRRPSGDTDSDREQGTPIELEDPPWKQRFERPWSYFSRLSRGGSPASRRLSVLVARRWEILAQLWILVHLVVHEARSHARRNAEPLGYPT